MEPSRKKIRKVSPLPLEVDCVCACMCTSTTIKIVYIITINVFYFSLINLSMKHPHNAFLYGENMYFPLKDFYMKIHMADILR